MSREQRQEDISGLRVHVEYTRKAVDEMRDELKLLPDALEARFDKKYASKSKVDKLEEVIRPFMKLRNKLWGFVVAAIVVGSLASQMGIDYVKDRFIP
jgi:hypothetical protein